MLKVSGRPLRCRDGRPVRQLPGDLVGTKPAKKRFRDVAEAAVSSWREHPGALTAVCVLPFGSFDGATAAGINLFDAVIHQWDIAVGAGIDHPVSEELAVVALSVAPLLVTGQARLSGHYAAPALPPAGAPPSARPLAATGRSLTGQGHPARRPNLPDRSIWAFRYQL